MDLEEFKKLNNNPDLISGIHNYCDRWCERCYLSSRCAVFLTENREGRDSKAKDMSNKEFWDELSNMFALTFEMLKEIADEQGMDLDAIPSQDIEINQQQLYEEIDRHPAAKMAQQYFDSVFKWLKENESLIEEKFEEEKKLLKLAGTNDKAGDNMLKLKDLIEIVRWYFSIIIVKTKRSLSGLLEDAEEMFGAQSDMNGSAKVVLIAIEKSIFAWNGLLKLLPQSEDEIYAHLVLLSRLKKIIEQSFPQANQFVRPGFDEVT